MSFGAKPVVVEPWDEHNQELVANVHPPDWVNPTPAPRYNLVIIGAGTAGLVTAAGAAGLGAKVALIERHLLGGDCLNVGCVPSKCLIRSSRTAADVRRSGQFGVKLSHDPEIDFGAVMERLGRLRAGLSRHLGGYDHTIEFYGNNPGTNIVIAGNYIGVGIDGQTRMALR